MLIEVLNHTSGTRATSVMRSQLQKVQGYEGEPRDAFERRQEVRREKLASEYWY